MQRCPLKHATLIVNPTFDMHHAHSVLILCFYACALPPPLSSPPPSTQLLPLSFSTCPHSLLQDGYFSHRPKEKSRVDSNNENSVPKDFENIDNSNFGARSQPQRQSVGATSSKQQREHLQEKAHAQQQVWRGNSPSLGRSSNEVLPVGHQPLVVSNNASYPGGARAPQHYGASQAQQAQSQHRHQRPHRRQATAAPLEVTYDQPPKCEIGGKEAISALNRAKSKECRQQIAEVYCRHKEGQLMPEKVTRYCPIEGESIIIIKLIDYLMLVYSKGSACGGRTVTLYSAQRVSQ